MTMLFNAKKSEIPLSLTDFLPLPRTYAHDCLWGEGWRGKKPLAWEKQLRRESDIQTVDGRCLNVHSSFAPYE